MNHAHSFFAFLFAALAASAASAAVEWTFPRLGSCHEGLAFSDGVTGVLVWGGGDTINLTVGRSDLWDHRGGYPWTVEQSYTNIVAAVRSGDKDRLYGLFKKDVPKGEPRNPRLLPLGRVTVTLPGAALKRGELNPYTGVGEIELADGRKIALAMSRKSRAFTMRLPKGAKVATRPAFGEEGVRKALEPVGFKAPVFGDTANAGGLEWTLPADPSVRLGWRLAENGDFVLATARGGAKPNLAASYATVASESVAQWGAFWQEGARVKVPDAKVQEVFDYGMYRYGAMTDPEGVPAGLQGPWLEDDRLVPWNGDYHFNINIQECYSPSFRGGHFAHLMPLFRMVLSWRPLLKDNARKFAGVDGYVLPHSVDDRGVCIGGFWTGTIDHASTAWIAALMYRYVKYADDTQFLKDGVYDFMKGAMRVYRAMMEEKDGKLSIPLGPSPEWGGANVQDAVGRDPSFQLAAAHRLARDLIDAAKRLGEKPDPMWLDVDKRLPAALVGKNYEGILLFENQPLAESHRHHSHLAGLYPFDTLDIEAMRKDGSLVATYEKWVSMGTGNWTGWCLPWAAILHTHFGQPTAAVSMLRAWEIYFCNPGHGSLHNAYNDGFSVYTIHTPWLKGRQIMQMDGQCAATTAVLELMVHEVNGKVEYFRGCPEYWTDVSFENVALSDGRRVSGRRLNGKVSVWNAKTR